MPLRLACVVGARPNFMKMAPLIRALESDSFEGRFEVTLIHTGQHYDANLSDVFFRELGMRRPDIALEVGSGSQAVQTARFWNGWKSLFLKGHHQEAPSILSSLWETLTRRWLQRWRRPNLESQLRTSRLVCEVLTEPCRKKSTAS